MKARRVGICWREREESPPCICCVPLLIEKWSRVVSLVSIVCNCLESLWVIEEFQSVKTTEMFLPWQNCVYTGKPFSSALEGRSIKSIFYYVTISLLGLRARTDTWITEPRSFQPEWTDICWQQWCDYSPRLISQLFLSLVSPRSRLKWFLYFTPCPSSDPIGCICSVFLKVAIYWWFWFLYLHSQHPVRFMGLVCCVSVSPPVFWAADFGAVSCNYFCFNWHFPQGHRM